MVRPAAGFLLILAVSATFSATRAQNPNPSALRTLRFVATGPKGEPITDLKPEEVQVSDSGKREPLLFAHLLRAAAGEPATLGPREVSNRGSDELFSSTLLLLDLLNANIDERGAAWNETVQSLGGLESAGNVYLFLMAPDASLYPVHAWNPGEAPAPESPPWTSKAGPLLNAALRKVEGIKPADLTAAPGLTVEPTYNALRMLARQYAALPGQKRIIWVTHGTPLTIVDPGGTVYADFGPELNAMAQEFVQLGISVYTVHQLDRSTTGIDSAETLQTLAPLTGGRWFENDAVGQALTQARTDARATYQAGYAVTAKEADEKYHKLRLTTTRKNVRILAEEGFTAVAPELTAKNTLDLVATRPFDTPDIGLRAAISSDPGAKEGNLHFQIHVDARDLAFERAGNSYTGEFTLSLFFFNADGERTAVASSVTKLNLSQDQLDATLKDGYVAMSDQAVPAGAVRGRLVVQDGLSGIAGSLGFPVSGK